jgi:hypothetical protein
VGRSGDAPWDGTTWDIFEAHAGKRLSLLAWGQPFGQLALGPLQSTLARGAVSLVTVDFPVSEILSGAANARVDAMAAAAKSFGSQILLRPGWEMNGTWYAWSRKTDYAAAWRRLVDRMRGAGATNVRFVWCVNVLYGTGSDPAPYYPGDAYVDYVGIDGYNWGVGSAKPDRWKTPSEVFGPTIQRCAEIAPTKQIVICETACTEHGGSKAEWIGQLLGNFLPSHPRIVGLCWFNDLADAAGMDWLIETSAAAQAAFKAGIASPYYLAP